MTARPTHYGDDELRDLCAEVGDDVHVHRSVLFFGRAVRIGSRVRIDAFSILSGQVDIGNNCHVASGVRLFGGSGRIVLSDFCGVSAGTSVYTATDDYVDGYLTGPTIPDPFKKLTSGDVILEKHCVIGAACVVLPGVHLGMGATVGALSLVSRDLGECVVAVGTPARPVKTRDRERLLRLEAEYLAALPPNRSAPRGSRSDG